VTASPISRSILAKAIAAAVLAVALAGPAEAPAAPPSDCRDQLCVAAVDVGAVEALWRSPETFYPNNEDVFASVHLGRRPLSAVRSYGPALCRHRFAAPGTTVVIKACGPGAQLVVRARRSKAGIGRVRIAYAAHPLIAGDAVAGSSAGIYAGLHQITGLWRG
jgi:hypothetical protein